MDTKTGHIHIGTDEQIDALRREGKDLVEIPPGEAESVINMNRHERRKWAKLARLEAKQRGG